jgi:acyl carrier protein
MTTTTNLLDDVTAIFKELLDDDTLVITPAYSRDTHPEWDSMTHLNIIFALEMKFGIKFGVADVEAIRSVADLLRLVQEKTSRS